MQLLQLNALRKPRHNVSITKIIIKGDWEIYVNYELAPQDNERKIVRFSCDERPRDEFIKAIEELKPNLCTICGLNSKVWETGRISSLSFKEKEQGSEVAIALRSVSEGAIVTAGIEGLYPKGEFLDKINNLVAEVEDYIDGVRQVQQMALFAPITSDEKAEELAGF